MKKKKKKEPPRSQTVYEAMRGYHPYDMPPPLGASHKSTLESLTLDALRVTLLMLLMLLTL